MANASAWAWPPKERMVGEEESAGEPCSVTHESQLVLTLAALRGRCSPAAAAAYCCCCCCISAAASISPCPKATAICCSVYCSSVASDCHWWKKLGSSITILENH